MIPTFTKKGDEVTFNTPQKRYIRNYIWAKYAKERIKKDKLDYIKYFTLTAAECYDILVLKEQGLLNVIEERGITKYQHVAFCEKDDEKYALIQKKLPGANHNKGSYENMIGAHGTIGANIQKWFPFDVINLDLTSAIFSSEKNLVIVALKKTFEIQSSKNKSFTLFLTIPSKEEEDTQTGKDMLDDNLRSNLNDSRVEDFKDRFSAIYPDVDFNGAIYSQLKYDDYLLISIPKMIVSMGFSENFDVVCNERLSYVGDHYNGNRNSTLMLKFVFECEFIGKNNGLCAGTNINELYEKYPLRVSNILINAPVNINELLENNAELKAHCCELNY
jgi:hypothetical protein